MKFYPTDATAGAVELLLVLVIIQLTLVAEALNFGWPLLPEYPGLKL